jgi:hypothetical protein
MDSILKPWKTCRKLYVSFLDTYTLEQLNKIPPGFNNNLIWNIGHVVATQHALVYALSGLPIAIPPHIFETYKMGTKPERDVTQDEADEIKRLLLSQVDQTEADLRNGKFTSFTGKVTATGFHLDTLTDALEFNNYHEGMHMGYMLSLRKFV